MARTKRWEQTLFSNGRMEYKLSSWRYFSDFINQVMLDYTNYVYRGHASSKWKLEPTLDRIIKSPTSEKRLDHLNQFKLETRGRRGSNPPQLKDDNDWWALGQHHGLSTPLLDWTESPFVALYFAAEAARKEGTSTMAVFSLFQIGVNLINKKIVKDEEIVKINGHKPTVKLVRPLSDENSRLVSQRGLFTRGPNNMHLEEWINTYRNKSSVKDTYIFLQKITIPTTGIVDCLKYLNRMNINHSTLFPDLTGASEFCNKHLSINRY
ncbi:MAG: FRG domain-containing protein [Candidatus Delongbacteria bacterium]|nr:FRG domain-containing protein [Candidatus Delongbacteria bacterium]